MSRSPTVIHYRATHDGPFIVKCRCGSYLSLPPEGLTCPCGRLHQILAVLPEAREKTIEPPKEESG